MSTRLQAVRGMNDILPDEAESWEWLEDVLRGWLKSYGYRPIRMPIVEPTPLFKRAIGEVTDIVEKEMYSFVDSLNGEALTLRPEGTAGCVRAVIQHNVAAERPQRLYYQGQMFRHERPQKGRYRQFHQVGVEAFGFTGPDVDAEQILMGARLWAELGLDNIRLELNSLGQPAERAAHRAALIEYFEAHQDQLDGDAQRRLHSNPLRILDTKNPAMQQLVTDAPRLMDYLGAESLAHFERVQALVRHAGISYTVNPRLVRGLDYYNLTVFEWVTDALGAQGTVCAGGRYDGLVEQLGGKPTPACGFALGVERLLALLQDAKILPQAESPDVYLIHQGDVAADLAIRVAESLRDTGLNVVYHCGGGSFKSQMKRADHSGAPLAVIIGDDEVAQGEVTVKAMRQKDWAEGETTNNQVRVALDDLAEHIMSQWAETDLGQSI
jgi:histidyl-tRNA synthetase